MRPCVLYVFIWCSTSPQADFSPSLGTSGACSKSVVWIWKQSSSTSLISTRVSVCATRHSSGILAPRYCPGIGRHLDDCSLRPALIYSTPTCFSSWMRRQRRRSRHASSHEAWSWSWRTADNTIAPTDVSHTFYLFLSYHVSIFSDFNKQTFLRSRFDYSLPTLSIVRGNYLASTSFLPLGNQMTVTIRGTNATIFPELIFWTRIFPIVVFCCSLNESQQ